MSNLDLKNDEEFKGLFPSDISDDEDELIKTKEEKSGKRKLEEEKPASKKKDAETIKKAPEPKKRKTVIKEESDDDDTGDKVVDFNMSDEDEIEEEESVGDDGKVLRCPYTLFNYSTLFSPRR